jgi:hypothetical protein
MQSLLQGIRDVAVTCAFDIGPKYHEELRSGLCGALQLQKFQAAKVSDYRDPPGHRFIAHRLLAVLYGF